ncbi:MAG TPA: MCE family protein [Acidimicrobiales bacterium]
MGGLANFLSSTVARLVLALAVIAALLTVGVVETEGSPTYQLHAVYSSAPGLFPGAAVDVLGVKVGTVTNVTNNGNKVDVKMTVTQGTHIPSNVVASLVQPQLLGAPDIDLNPGYTGGPMLPAGATIAENHTSVPVSTDQVLKEIQHTLNALNPKAVGNLVSNLAADLDGQGANLNKLIASAAGTIQLLATKGNDLGQLNGTLAQLTGTLDTDTNQIEQLVAQYDTVSTTLAKQAPQLNDAITQLAQGSTSLVNLLVPNLQPLEADVGTVTTVGRTLDRNLSSVDEILAQGNNLFQGASRAYDPNYNWLDLNLELAPGVTGAYVSGLIRDRLAGICRRIVANHSAGLTTAELSSLNLCGDPSSNFFNPLLNEIPTILNALTANSASETGSQLLQKGLNQILAIQPADGGAASNAGSPPRSSEGNTPTTTTPAPTTTTTPSTTPTTTPPKSCTGLAKLLECPSSSTDSSSGLGSLLSSTSTSSSPSKSNATLAANTSGAVNPDPTLNAPGADLLGPLPQDATSHAHHASHKSHGLLAQWAHDVWSIF